MALGMGFSFFRPPTCESHFCERNRNRNEESEMFHIKNILNQMMRLSLLASMGFAVFLYGASPASAQVLGAAQSFVVLGGSSVSFAGSGNVMTGDVGVSTGTSVTGSYTVTVP